MPCLVRLFDFGLVLNRSTKTPNVEQTTIMIVVILILDTRHYIHCTGRTLSLSRAMAWIKLPTALLLVTCALTATSTGRAAPCPALEYYKHLGYKTGRNIKIQSACTCGANANQTLDVCEKYHYCDASKTSGQRCSSRPFDR